MKSVLRTTGIVAGITALAISSAHAQPVIGGAGDFGLFAPLIDYFRANMLQGILYIAVAAVFAGMLWAHFHLKTAVLVACGLVGIISTPQIVASLRAVAGG